MKEEIIYKQMYLALFNSVTDILEIVETDPKTAKSQLQAAQQHCEQIYMDADFESSREMRIERDKYGNIMRFL